MKNFNVDITVVKRAKISVAAKNAEDAAEIVTKLYLLNELDYLTETVHAVRASTESRNENGHYVETSVYASDKKGFWDVHPAKEEILSLNENDELEEDDDEDFGIDCEICPCVDECKRKEQLE